MQSASRQLLFVLTLVWPLLAGHPAWAQSAVVLRGGTVWDGTGAVRPDTDVLLQGGLVRQLGRKLTAPAGAREVDVRGKVVTPGLVDMHSHLGVYAAPSTSARHIRNATAVT